jgi:hypothetical protein
MKFIYDDGGRASAGYRGDAGDCVTGAIAIATATDKPYQEVYDALNALGTKERTGKRKRGTSSARTGVHKLPPENILNLLAGRLRPPWLSAAAAKFTSVRTNYQATA